MKEFAFPSNFMLDRVLGFFVVCWESNGVIVSGDSGMATWATIRDAIKDRMATWSEGDVATYNLPNGRRVEYKSFEALMKAYQFAANMAGYEDHTDGGIVLADASQGDWTRGAANDDDD